MAGHVMAGHVMAGHVMAGHVMAWPCYGFVDGLSYNALMCIKKSQIN